MIFKKFVMTDLCLLGFFSVFFILIGCKQQKLTEDYLLEHPAVLEKELQFCMSYDSSSNEQIERCKIAADAQSRLSRYLEIQQTDPERFGQQILDAEMALAGLKETLDKAKQFTIDVRERTKSVSEKEVAMAFAKKNAAEKAYLEKQKEVKVLLVVAGLNSPE